jgi:transglutaminase-like putative cysteine protease
MDKLLSTLARLINLAMFGAATLIGLLLVFMVSASIIEYYTVSLPTSHVKVAKFVVRHKACTDPEYPVLVSFHNQSDRTVLSVSFSFEAYIRGRSTNLADWNSRKDDQIMKPGETSTSCWALPKLQDDAYEQVHNSNRLAHYAAWLRANVDKRGTSDFEKVAAAYKLLRTTPQQHLDYKLRRGWVEFRN